MIVRRYEISQPDGALMATALDTANPFAPSGNLPPAHSASTAHARRRRRCRGRARRRACSAIVIVYGRGEGRERAQPRASSPSPRSDSAAPGGGILPEIVGTLLIVALATAFALPIGVLIAIFLTRVLDAAHRLPDPARARPAQRPALDRHRRLRLRAARARPRPEGLRGLDRARDHHGAADRARHPGGAAAGPAEPARRRARARHQHAGARRSASCCRPALGASSPAPCSPSRAPPARRRRCCSLTSLYNPNSAVTLNMFGGVDSEHPDRRSSTTSESRHADRSRAGLGRRARAGCDNPDREPDRAGAARPQRRRMYR